MADMSTQQQPAPPSLDEGIGNACPIVAAAGRIADDTGAVAGSSTWNDTFRVAGEELRKLGRGQAPDITTLAATIADATGTVTGNRVWNDTFHAAVTQIKPFLEVAGARRHAS